MDSWQTTQSRAFVAHLRHARGSPLYRSANIREAITVEDIRQLPMTTKDQLAAAGKAALAIPEERVTEWVSTSGTAGKPLDVPLSARDLERIAENEEFALTLAGVGRHDLVLLCVGMDRLFIAGLAYYLGARKIGATVLRLGPQVASNPALLHDMLPRFARSQQRVHMISVPSFLQHLEPRATQNLAAIIAIGEPTRSQDLQPTALAADLAGRFRCPILSTYASTETCTTFAEGPGCLGNHLNPRLAVVECVDSADHPVAAGEPGELVITPLGVEAMPLLRFKTGDISTLMMEACPCGRDTPRIGPILGRRQHLLKFRGTSIYPNMLLDAIRNLPGIADCVLIATSDHALSDHLTLCVALKENIAESAARGRLESHLRSILRATPEIKFLPAGELLALQTPANGRKLTRFLDRRGGVNS